MANIQADWQADRQTDTNFRLNYKRDGNAALIAGRQMSFKLELCAIKTIKNSIVSNSNNAFYNVKQTPSWPLVRIASNVHITALIISFEWM